MTSSTVLSMSMSLDGFIAGPNESADNGLGDGGDRLHTWVFPGGEGDRDAAVARLRGANRQIYDEFMSTGAVVAGRGTFEPAGGWGGDHHDGVPIYILSRDPAPALSAGLLDEIEIHLVPILMGEGRRLFEHLGTGQRELERVRVLEGEGGVTHLRYRVVG